jgi:S1-C subfamily serine protease
MQKLVTSIVAIALLANAQALTTVDIVAKTKPCIVTIVVTNSKNPDKAVSGTGFFIDSDKIMTADHIVEGDYDKIHVYDLVGKPVLIENPVYLNSDKSVDVAILQTKEGNHPFLTVASTPAAEGQNVVVIGNPQGLTGTCQPVLSPPFALAEQ